MNKELKLKTTWKSHVTKIQFGIDFVLKKALPALLEEYKRKTAVITDQNVESIFGHEFDPLDLKIFSFPPGEASKTRDTKILLEDHLLSHNFSKDSLIIGFGGGVVNDITGFLASTYCRGISFIQIPTTLLGMVDASVGGKNGVNTPYGKNMIGTFHPPDYVLVDGFFLKTLPQKEWTSGLVEMIKIALATSAFLFNEMFTEYEQWKSGDLPFQMNRIYECIELKSHVVEKDPEEERGMRRVLNLGHTFGHAIETLEEYQISHGEAIAVGILICSYISQKLGLLSEEDALRIREIFKLYEIPISLKNKHSLDDWMAVLTRDKKAKRGSPRMVLLEKIGSIASFEGEYCTEIDFSIIEDAIEWIYREFHNDR